MTDALESLLLAIGNAQQGADRVETRRSQRITARKRELESIEAALSHPKVSRPKRNEDEALVAFTHLMHDAQASKSTYPEPTQTMEGLLEHDSTWGGHATTAKAKLEKLAFPSLSHVPTASELLQALSATGNLPTSLQGAASHVFGLATPGYTKSSHFLSQASQPSYATALPTSPESSQGTPAAPSLQNLVLMHELAQSAYATPTPSTLMASAAGYPSYFFTPALFASANQTIGSNASLASGAQLGSTTQLASQLGIINSAPNAFPFSNAANAPHVSPTASPTASLNPSRSSVSASSAFSAVRATPVTHAHQATPTSIVSPNAQNNLLPLTTQNLAVAQGLPSPLVTTLTQTSANAVASLHKLALAHAAQPTVDSSFTIIGRAPKRIDDAGCGTAASAVRPNASMLLTPAATTVSPGSSSAPLNHAAVLNHLSALHSGGLTAGLPAVGFATPLSTPSDLHSSAASPTHTLPLTSTSVGRLEPRPESPSSSHSDDHSDLRLPYPTSAPHSPHSDEDSTCTMRDGFSSGHSDYSATSSANSATSGIEHSNSPALLPGCGLYSEYIHDLRTVCSQCSASGRLKSKKKPLVDSLLLLAFFGDGIKKTPNGLGYVIEDSNVARELMNIISSHIRPPSRGTNNSYDNWKRAMGKTFRKSGTYFTPKDEETARYARHVEEHLVRIFERKKLPHTDH